MIERLLEQIEKCESEIDYEKHRDKYLDTLVHSYPTLTLSEEKELFQLYDKTRDRTYKDIIFKCNLKVVHDTCTDTTGYRDDLISEGIVLLCEFIEHFDYKMPNTTFTQALKSKLSVLYNSKKIENNKQLNTEMSIEELKQHEEEGKCYTDSDYIKPIKHNAKRKRLIVVFKEGIIIVPRYNEELDIVPNPVNEKYLINRREGKDIFNKVFSKPPKKLINKPFRKIKPGDMDY